MRLIEDKRYHQQIGRVTPRAWETELCFAKFYTQSQGETYYPFFLKHLPDHFPIHDLVDPIHIDQLRKGNIRPIVILVTESFNLFETFNNNSASNTPYHRFMNTMARQGIPEENFIWVVNNPDIDNQVSSLKGKGVKISSRFTHFNFFLQHQAKLSKKAVFQPPKFFRHHYISLAAGEPRHHRYGITYQLYKSGLVSKGKVSCTEFKNFSYRFSNCEHSQNNIDTTRYLKKLDIEKDGDIHSFIRSLPLNIDFKSDPTDDIMSEHHLYDDIFIDLVNETHQPDNQIFVTEKTFRPVSHLRPFLINGDKFTLRHLKSLGFKTFNNWWDESYDECITDQKRLLLLTDVLKKLCALNPKDLLSIYKDMLPILNYNKRTLEEYDQFKNLELAIEGANSEPNTAWLSQIQEDSNH